MKEPKPDRQPSSPSRLWSIQTMLALTLTALTLGAALLGSSSARAQQQFPAASVDDKNQSYLETGKQITKILDKFMSRGYDKRVRPNYGGAPVEVNVTMRILSISSVSEVMMDFTADFYFRQTWHDPRLAFEKLGSIETLYVGAEVSQNIWLPDTFFGNEKTAYFHSATTPNVFLRIDHSGEVYRSIRLTVTSSCPMNLHYFPMDHQNCTIEAESYGYDIKDIIYRWARSPAVERNQDISLPQFDIVKIEQKYRLEELSSGTYSRLIAEIHFARRMGYYLIQIYVPSSLIVVISWVSFWLHRNASPARVQLGVTTVLTMTTLMSSTNAALPKISYVKSIDIFLGTCFIMVFAALLEYATVGYLGKRIAMRKAQLQHAAQAHAQAQAQAHFLAQLEAHESTTSGAQHTCSTSDPNPQSQYLMEQLALTEPEAKQDADSPPSPPPRSLASQKLEHFHHTHNYHTHQHHHHHHNLFHTCKPVLLSEQSKTTKSIKCRPNQLSSNQEPDERYRCACCANDLPGHLELAKQEQEGPRLAISSMMVHSNPEKSSMPDHHQLSPIDYLAQSNEPRNNKDASSAAAAAAAAAIFVNMHRRNKGLPPSSNPNFAQSFAWMDLSYATNRTIENIFGIRPSDIDKYSRVVFPVCFLCFQLMYWIVYLHISAFLETAQQN